MDMVKLLYGIDVLDGLKQLEDESVHCVVTSPPYWGLRSYGVDGQLGLEKTPEEFVAKMVEVFREVKRVLRNDGTLWLNLGDSYVSAKSRYSSRPQTISGKHRGEPIDNNHPDLKGHAFLKDKDLCGIPWRVAFALQADGWYLRSDIIWAKPNPMPESVTDRPTKAHEYIFLLTKSAKYYYDSEAIKEPVSDISLKRAEYGWDCDRPSTKNKSNGGEGIHTEKMGERFVNPSGRNKRSVWEIATESYPEAHFATYPKKLVLPCILAGCPVGGTVLDPFSGSGTTGEVATGLGRKYIGIDLNLKYLEFAKKRIGLFAVNDSHK